MRLIFPSATITITVFASRAKALVAVRTSDDNENNHADSKSQANGNRDTTNYGYGEPPVAVASSLSVENDECNYQPSAVTKSNNRFKTTTTIQSRKQIETVADVGVLAVGSGSGSGGCRYPIRQTCVPDNTSSLGGRCRNKLTINSSNNKSTQQHDHHQTTTPRFLQEDEEEDPFVCVTTCPTELCTCANTTEYGFPDAQDCATELNAVCTATKGVDDCFPSDELPFYQEVYCEFASCWLKDGSTYEDCACGYYQNYCGLYGEYATAEYPKIVAKCLVSDCCDGASTGGEKIMCIPALMPSSVPSVGPTESLVPSAFVLPTTLTPTGAPAVDTPEDTPEDNTPVPTTTSIMGESFPPTPTPKTMTSLPSSKPSKTKPQATTTTTTTTSPLTDSEVEESPTVISNDTLPEEGTTTTAPPPPNDNNGGIYLQTNVSSMMVLVFASVGWGSYWVFA